MSTAFQKKVENKMFFGGMEEPNPHVSFGTSADRPCFPEKTANDKFGNQMTPFTGVKDVGPGQYENHETTAFVNNHPPLSKKGYSMGARTEKREFYSSEVRAPSPTHYQDVERPFVKPSLNPFNMSSNRFKKTHKIVDPGPGAYEHDVERNRNVQMLHSFGGRVKTIPHVHIKCSVYNEEKACENCNQKPNGDFYQLKSSVLCNRCFEYNYKWQEKYSRAYLSTFKKARDCSFIHEHDGTTAAVQKISDKELRKLKQKEAYLSLYWD